MTWIEEGPPGGPLMLFLHGWPERGLIWRAQLAHFARLGWRCVAPDMRGYGRAGPGDPDAYSVSEAVADMVELHDSLGGAPAVWVGHDWGSPVAYGLAAHHPGRVRAVASTCVPYLPGGFALSELVPLVNRDIYPADRYPDGQWSYYRFYSTDFERAVSDFQADVAATVALLFRPGAARVVGKPARSAGTVADGGWFPGGRAPDVGREHLLLPPADFDEVVAGLSRVGFRGPCSWYLNDEANREYALSAPDAGRLTMPVLFVHAAWDTICDTLHSALADPMRAACADLTEATVEAGHIVMLEKPGELNETLANWLETAVR